MKREFIKELLPDITKEALDAIMAENGKDIESTKTKFSDYEDLKTQLSEAGKTIDGFKAMDIDGIKQAAEDYKAKAEKAEADRTADISKLQFDHALDGALSGVKAKNAKAVKALLDMGGLKLNGEEIVGLKEQLDKIKTDNDYLFEGEKPAPGIFAGKLGGAGTDLNVDAFTASVRKAAGLPDGTTKI